MPSGLTPALRHTEERRMRYRRRHIIEAIATTG